MSFEEQVIDAIQTAAAALEKADEIYEKQAATGRQVASLIPSVVDELAKRGYIDHMEKDAASRALRDHTKALQILARVVSRGPTQKSAATIGKPYSGDPGAGSAGVRSSSAFRVVSREADSQANRAFLRALGLEHMLS